MIHVTNHWLSRKLIIWEWQQLKQFPVAADELWIYSVIVVNHLLNGHSSPENWRVKSWTWKTKKLILPSIPFVPSNPFWTVKSNTFRQFHTSSIQRTDDLHPRIWNNPWDYNPSSLLGEFDQNLTSKSSETDHRYWNSQYPSNAIPIQESNIQAPLKR